MSKLNNPVHIIAEITPKPQFFDDGLAAITAIIPATKNEPGCIQFDVYENREGCSYFLVEEFVDESALKSHYEQRYTKSVFELYETILAKEPDVKYVRPVKITT